eukprot:gb/GEZN01013037.1/.p1 GENE.gb/GEZN01013037.1/~~gb/GEZN01013037.1/.p1  ORF type:complete len:254 (+),score=25.11 gb/GEZN01013037.1/:67-828(+)
MGIALLKQLGTKESELDVGIATDIWDHHDRKKAGFLDHEHARLFVLEYGERIGFTPSRSVIDGFFQLYDPLHTGKVFRKDVVNPHPEADYPGCANYQAPPFGGKICVSCQKSVSKHMPKAILKDFSQEEAQYEGCDSFKKPARGNLCFHCLKPEKKHSPRSRGLDDDAVQALEHAAPVSPKHADKPKGVVDCAHYEAPSVGTICKACQKSMKMHSAAARVIKNPQLSAKQKEAMMHKNKEEQVKNEILKSYTH